MPINELVSLLVLATGALIFVFMLYMGLVSIQEHEPRAAGLSFLLAFGLAAPFLLVGLLPFNGQVPAGIALLAATVLVGALSLCPFGQRKFAADETPRVRIDERDIMFARSRLQPGTERFEAYYRANPEKKALDDKFREKPGLLRPGSIYFDPVAFAAAEASFETVTAFHPLLERQPGLGAPLPVKSQEMSVFLKKWTKKLGAVSVGITELKDYHLYSAIGRGEPYGAPIDLHHKYAIALTVEMDKTMLDSAPYGPALMESAQQYLNVGAIAVQLAEFIHGLGYPARAHIDGSYRVVCPLVARDAGLGEIGRMGLLMTPELGPRVRLAVVTTDLPLVADARRRDDSVLDFCARCKKCADTCPGKAIPFDDRTEVEGVKRWKINSEACFTYWCAIGTDCGRCMRVCPYSHPNNLMHNLVRLGVRNSPFFRLFALQMDDFFYGRKPAPVPVPDWIKAMPETEGK
jgi:ferredoxin